MEFHVGFPFTIPLPLDSHVEIRRGGVGTARVPRSLHSKADIPTTRAWIGVLGRAHVTVITQPIVNLFESSNYDVACGVVGANL